MVAEAAARAGHDVRVLDLMFERDPIRALKGALVRFRPEVIGLSVRNIDGNDMQDPVLYAGELRPIVRAIRGITESTIVLGGPAVSVMPEELMRYTGVDLAVIGNGEFAFPELLDNLSDGTAFKKTPGIAWIEDGLYMRNPPHPRTSNVSDTPEYRRWIDTRAYRSRLSTVSVQTKRGCHFKCVYCTYRKIEGQSYRCFEPGSVRETVRRLVAQGLRDIEFVDNVFNSP
jgi:radical SAM superfamily enzyme YgiQ (UPF0313 family)